MVLMASYEHLSILELGRSNWNAWREENVNIIPDLSHSDLNDRNLRGTNFIACNLKGVKLNRSDLRGVNMRNADLSYSHISSADLSRVNLISANLSKANIRQANLHSANLRNSNMAEVNLHDTNLRKAILDGSDLCGAHLIRVQARATKFRNVNLQGADLEGADLEGADLRYCVFTGANLRRANLRSVNLTQAELDGADLSDANLSHVVIVQSNLQNSNLSNCRVYGLSAWDVKLQNSVQYDLIITRYHEPKITVDNIEVAQFIYLLLNNEKIRDIIDTVTSKVVLILGRFTTKRKPVLDSLREELRKHNYSPIIFDFGPPSSRDLSETIMTLAHLARFIIVDITNPRSVPQELQAIVHNLCVPVIPILGRASKAYGMFEGLNKYPWVLEIFRYDNKSQLINSLVTSIIAPAEAALTTLKSKSIPVLSSSF